MTSSASIRSSPAAPLRCSPRERTARSRSSRKPTCWNSWLTSERSRPASVLSGVRSRRPPARACPSPREIARQSRHTGDDVTETPHTPGFETLAIHAGQDPEAATGAVVVPIFQHSTFAQEAVGKNKGYEYARTGNPPRTALETCLAALEGARWALAFASGMAASDAVAHLLSKDDHVVKADDVYGGTNVLIERDRDL